MTGSTHFPERNMRWKKEPPSLVDLCIQTAIDNVRYLGDVGETDIDMLKKILPHCTADQLMHIEKSTEERDLSPVTDELWRTFYKQQFGVSNYEVVTERMKWKKVSFKWIQLYQAKLKDMDEVQKKSVARLKQLYKKDQVKKQSRQIQITTKVPPSSSRRSFGGGGLGSNFPSTKGNLMKKSRMEFLQSHELKVHAAMRKNVLQRNQSVSRPVQPIGFRGKDMASSSKLTNQRS